MSLKKESNVALRPEKTARSTWCVFFVAFLQNRKGKKKKTVTDEAHWRAGSASQSNFPLHGEQDINKNILSSPLHFPLLLCGGEKRSNGVWLAIVQPLSFFIPGTSLFVSPVSSVLATGSKEMARKGWSWEGEQETTSLIYIVVVQQSESETHQQGKGWGLILILNLFYHQALHGNVVSLPASYPILPHVHIATATRSHLLKKLLWSCLSWWAASLSTSQPDSHSNVTLRKWHFT